MSNEKDPFSGAIPVRDGKDRDFRAEGDIDMFGKGDIEFHCADCRSLKLQVDALKKDRHRLLAIQHECSDHVDVCNLHGAEGCCVEGNINYEIDDTNLTHTEGDVTTAPTGNPIDGWFDFVENGVPKRRLADGTVVEYRPVDSKHGDDEALEPEDVTE